MNLYQKIKFIVLKNVTKGVMKLLTKTKTSIKSGVNLVSQLANCVGRNVWFETIDGIIREGKITDLKTKELIFNNNKASLVTDLIINNDSSDVVHINHLAKIEIY